MLYVLGSHHVNRGKIHKNIRGLCWSNKVKSRSIVFWHWDLFILLCSATFECGDLLSYLDACTMPCGLSVHLALLPFGVAVCVLLSARNESLYLSVCCLRLFWHRHYVWMALYGSDHYRSLTYHCSASLVLSKHNVMYSIKLLAVHIFEGKYCVTYRVSEWIKLFDVILTVHRR